MKTSNNNSILKLKYGAKIFVLLTMLLNISSSAIAQTYSGHIECTVTPNSMVLLESERAVQDSQSMLLQISDLSTETRIKNKDVSDPVSSAALKSIMCDLSVMDHDLDMARSAVRIAEADFRAEAIPEKQEVVTLTQNYYNVCVRSYETAQSLLNSCS